jgi:hypothetical protein
MRSANGLCRSVGNPGYIFVCICTGFSSVRDLYTRSISLPISSIRTHISRHFAIYTPRSPIRASCISI